MRGQLKRRGERTQIAATATLMGGSIGSIATLSGIGGGGERGSTTLTREAAADLFKCSNPGLRGSTSNPAEMRAIRAAYPELNIQTGLMGGMHNGEIQWAGILEEARNAVGFARVAWSFLPREAQVAMVRPVVRALLYQPRAHIQFELQLLGMPAWQACSISALICCCNCCFVDIVTQRVIDAIPDIMDSFI